jgi:hypothetical protein
MKQAIIISFLLLLVNLALAHVETPKKKSLYFELAGSGGFGSINFEKHFYKKKKYEFTWRTGLSLAPIDRNNGIGLVFPLMINLLIGKNAHKLELGFGQGITITTMGNFSAVKKHINHRKFAVNNLYVYRKILNIWPNTFTNIRIGLILHGMIKP